MNAVNHDIISAAEIVAQLMRSKTARFFYQHMVVIEPG